LTAALKTGDERTLPDKLRSGTDVFDPQAATDERIQMDTSVAERSRTEDAIGGSITTGKSVEHRRGSRHCER
jgi:hypothetical protein